MKNLIKLLCISGEIIDGDDIIIEDRVKEESKWEEHRGAFIFWSICAGITIFFIIPWLAGVVTLFRWIF